MSIVTAPKPQTLVQMEAVRAQLQQAAELAVDASGVVDTAKVGGEMGAALAAIAGADQFEMGTLMGKLDAALDQLDRADVRGPAKPLYFGYMGVSSTDSAALHRRYENNREDIEASPIMAHFRRRFTMRNRNMVLDSAERKEVEGANDPVVGKVLDLADAKTRSAAEAVAEKYFSGIQVLHRDYWDEPSPNSERGYTREYQGFVRGEPGALRDVKTVMVKHEDSGKWFVAPVAADGSYEVKLAKYGGALSVWYENEDGEKFFGGRTMMYGNTHTDDVGGFPMLTELSDHAEAPPLRYAPRRGG